MSDINKINEKKGEEVLLNELQFFTKEKQKEIKAMLKGLETDIGICASKGSEGDNLVLLNMLDELCDLSPRLKFMDCEDKFERVPSFGLYREDGASAGVIFSGVPGGHEIDSVVFALYNLGGGAKEVSQDLQDRIKRINKRVKIEIAVTLSCPHCPKAVINAQRIAILSEKVTAEMIDVEMFPEIREKYNIQSVPTLIVNGHTVQLSDTGIEGILCAIEKEI